MGSQSTAAIMVTPACLLVIGLFQLAQAQSQCPEPYGIQTYPHEGYCDQFYKCTNGTLTEETCENGLVYDGHGDINNYCNYNWAVNCEKRVYDDTPISSPGCLYQYGIYPVGEGCQTTFFKCAKGVAFETPCPRGLSYSASIHVCDYPANVEYCESEGVVGFKCPLNSELPANAVARRFLPFPRFPDPSDEAGYIVCVNNEPRIQHCGDGAVFDPQTLSCLYYEEQDLAPIPLRAARPQAPIPFAGRPQRISPFGHGK